MSDIQQLFLEDPMKLTREDLKPMAAYYRERRSAFNLGDAQAGSAKRLKKPTEKITISADEILKGL